MNTPYYIPHIERFRSNIEKFSNEVNSIYPNYKYAYSFKTNSYKPFCEQVRKTSSLAEIVSPDELKLAISTGFKLEDIVYNGVIPDFRNKINIARAGGIVNLENEDEIYKFANYANKNKQIIYIGVRLNIAENLGVNSRFGVPPSGSFYKYLCDKNSHPYLNIKCVHCHIHGARQLEMFEKRIDTMAKYAKELGASIIDIGGNMYGNIDSAFRKQYQEKVPTTNEYAHLIGECMKKNFPNCSETLISEGGTLIVSDCMDLATQVLNIKTTNGKIYLIVDTKPSDVGFVCGCKNPSIETTSSKNENSILVKDAIVEGCTCVEDAYIGTYSGYIKNGDVLKIKNVGAYSFSVRNDFITRKCKVKSL